VHDKAQHSSVLVVYLSLGLRFTVQTTDVKQSLCNVERAPTVDHSRHIVGWTTHGLPSVWLHLLSLSILDYTVFQKTVLPLLFF